MEILGCSVAIHVGLIGWLEICDCKPDNCVLLVRESERGIQRDVLLHLSLLGGEQLLSQIVKHQLQ